MPVESDAAARLTGVAAGIAATPFGDTTRAIWNGCPDLTACPIIPSAIAGMPPFHGALLEDHGLRAELKMRDWPSPIERSDRPQRHHLHLNLPPVGYHGLVHASEFDAAGPWPVGRCFYRPADVLLHSTGTGGRAFSVDCSFDAVAFADTVGGLPDWTSDRLRRSCDLDASPVPPLLARIAQELRLPARGRATMVGALARQAAIELIRYLDPDQPIADEGARLSSGQLGRIEARLAAEELAPPSVAELAQLISVSERHLLRLFQATTGTTVRAHIRRRLMDRAQVRLREGRPIKQIAYELGFAHAGSFASAFRKATGTGPAQWRALQP